MNYYLPIHPETKDEKENPDVMRVNIGGVIYTLGVDVFTENEIVNSSKYQYHIADDLREAIDNLYHWQPDDREKAFGYRHIRDIISKVNAKAMLDAYNKIEQCTVIPEIGEIWIEKTTGHDVVVVSRSNDRFVKVVGFMPTFCMNRYSIVGFQQNFIRTDKEADYAKQLAEYYNL